MSENTMRITENQNYSMVTAHLHDQENVIEPKQTVTFGHINPSRMHLAQALTETNSVKHSQLANFLD